MYTLIIEESLVTLLKFNLEQEVTTVGRAIDNTIRINKNGVSRYHAKIELKGNTPVITDLDSKNGTRVNGLRIKEKILHDGDEIILGDAILSFKYSSDMRSLQISDEKNLKGESATRFVKPARELLASLEMSEAATIEDMVDTTHLIKEDYDKLNIHYKFLNNLYQVTKAINSSMDIQNLLDMIMDRIIDATSAERGFLMIMDENSGELIPQVIRNENGKEIEISKTIIDTVLKDEVSILTLDAASDTRFKESESIILYGIHSAMCVPLLIDNKIIGIIHVDRKHSAKPFDEDDLKVLTAVANQAVIALHRSRLMFELGVKNKELEAANKKHGIDLIRAEKARVIGYYAAGMRHHFKQPMTVILNGIGLLEENIKEIGDFANLFNQFSQIIQQYGSGDVGLEKVINTIRGNKEEIDKVQSLFSKILQKEEDALHLASEEGGLKTTFNDILSSVRRINEIIDILNRYAALDVAEIEETISVTDINQDIEDCLVIFENLLEGIEVIKELDEKIPSVGCYARELKTAFLNVFENSVDFIKIKKIINPDFKPQIIFKTEYIPDVNNVFISIRDNGPGVPEHLKKYAFDAFVSSRDESNPGLGLYIARDIIVNMHGGDISLESKENEFTEIKIKIPKDPKPSSFLESA
ncbi:GAF domain-containing protein [bacterium]|nr:GAF domain-containing protein [bacterium]